ncbi:ATP-binding protein [Xanthomonas campestris pv. raphani]|nr:ATP-binding protein [Xanthomonas campestris]MEA9770420.1 ATP-binding protein [Xanthomonas campestris pv. raphani]MEA9798822.1 ATP-binding protein [Xanthomonas campestris pv. raphani]MEA9830923.1 ATP-binding protein [Xanthomonas campestris pv. raphani]MEA9949973.1 ATP-binding protein [Xanthomonas campestris pv. raphani]MEA9952407.1 ATP-binding protein [Xanthomonas campestris pv. raphani]
MYREIFDNVDAGFCIIDMVFEGDRPTDYIFRVTNEAFQRYTGLSEVANVSMRSLRADHEQEWFDRYGHVALTGNRIHFEMQAKALNRWYSVDAFRVGPPELKRVAVLFMDITERKRVERELAESEARFSALADGLPMPVWVLDAQGVVRFVNSAYGEFFGVDISSGTVSAWSELLHPEDVPVFQFELAASLEEQRGLHALVRARRHDGQWRWIEMTATPRYSADGRFIGLAGSSPDVTEQREIALAREQLLESERSARNEAESMARLKDEFLATLSHELRTPLTTILGWSELLLQRVEEGHPNYKGLSVIASSARAQKRLISDMLDLSSMLLGKVQLEVESLDLAEQVREALGAQEPVAEGKDQVLQLHVLPTPCLVLGDATRLQQVFWNLLSNAIKFTPAHGRIDVTVEHDDGHFIVSVRDSGDGIASEFLPHLFGRFRQADATTTRQHGGLGLGLAIVQQLVEMHGGQVGATSGGRGKGATFTVRLPEHQPDQAKRPRRELRRRLMSEQIVEARALNGLRLLAVEDQPDMLDYLRRLLEEQGAEVVTAGSATDALALIDHRGYARFDLMLTDIGMPGMDGYGLIRTVRENMGLDATALPAVAVTALARDDDRQRALASGFQEHLAKPYSVAQLVTAVRAAREPAE